MGKTSADRGSFAQAKASSHGQRPTLRAPGPEVASPVPLAKFGELHLNAMRGAAFDSAHEIADGNVGRYRNEHVDMLSRQNYEQKTAKASPRLKTGVYVP
jgi:hypothetical protein